MLTGARDGREHGKASRNSQEHETGMRSTPARVLGVIPVHGDHQMTHDLLADLWRERTLVDVVVVDNGGDYRPAGDEVVLRPGKNLGWAGATNYGTEAKMSSEYSGALWLNNDTRLAEGFVGGLIRCWQDTDAALVGPFYDCYWSHQRLRRPVPVDVYRPRPRHFRAPFLDGTCIFAPAATIDAIGLLDAATFSPIGWGAEIDYGLRARSAGFELATTQLSYLHHEKSVTGKRLYEGGLRGYAERGYPVLMNGMREKWGENWRVIAGIEDPSSQTRRPGWRRRLPGLRSRMLRTASASRRRSSPL
jgi:GT2 family glycosyltransferase